MATESKNIDLSDHHGTIKLACAELIKKLEARDPQQRVLVKSAVAVIEQIEDSDA